MWSCKMTVQTRRSATRRTSSPASRPESKSWPRSSSWRARKSADLRQT
jgi:hypothetical protein